MSLLDAFIQTLNSSYIKSPSSLSLSPSPHSYQPIQTNFSHASIYFPVPILRNSKGLLRIRNLFPHRDSYYQIATMSSSYLIQFPVENVSLNIIPLSWLLICMVEFSLLHALLKKVGGAHKFLSRIKSFIKSRLGFLFADSDAQVVKKNLHFEFSYQVSLSKREECRLNTEEVEMVMERLGIFCHPEDEKLQKRLGSDDLSNLFEEMEPCLLEVKGAFDVFDENKDGFIDAEELQRVLCVLGFKEGLDMQNCRRTIRVFDRNGDGRIDFGQFVKIMENAIC